MSRYICGQCTKGLAAGEVKTFSSRCPGCVEKKASGLRTGKEPAPVKWPCKQRVARAVFMEKVKKDKKLRRERQAFWLSTPVRSQP